MQQPLYRRNVSSSVLESIAMPTAAKFVSGINARVSSTLLSRVERARLLFVMMLTLAGLVLVSRQGSRSIERRLDEILHAPEPCIIELLAPQAYQGLPQLVDLLLLRLPDACGCRIHTLSLETVLIERRSSIREGSIVVVDEHFWTFSDGILESMRRLPKMIGIIHLGDEAERHAEQLQTYDLAAFVYRNYRRDLSQPGAGLEGWTLDWTYLKVDNMQSRFNAPGTSLKLDSSFKFLQQRLKNIERTAYWFPLGSAPTFYHSHVRDIPLMKRDKLWSFAGSTMGKKDRQRLLVSVEHQMSEKLQNRGILHVYDHSIGRGAIGAINYANLLFDTVFCLCPRGTNAEQFRLWEAIEAGCIPIVTDGHTTREQLTPHIEIGLDLMFVKEWQHLPSLLEQYVDSPWLHEVESRNNYAWLELRKSSLQVARARIYNAMQRHASANVCNLQRDVSYLTHNVVKD